MKHTISESYHLDAQNSESKTITTLQKTLTRALRSKYSTKSIFSSVTGKQIQSSHTGLLFQGFRDVIFRERLTPWRMKTLTFVPVLFVLSHRVTYTSLFCSHFHSRSTQIRNIHPRFLRTAIARQIAYCLLTALHVEI